MTDPFANEQPQEAPASPVMRQFIQFSVLGIMLFTLLVAMWVDYARTTQLTEDMKLELPGLRDSARELIITDPDQYAVVQEHMLWNNDYRWRIYLPENQKYQLKLALEEIAPKGFPASAETIELSPGEHELQLRYLKDDNQQWQIDVLVDNDVLISQTRPQKWNDSGSSSGASSFSTSAQKSLEESLQIFRQRYYIKQEDGSSTDPGPSANGLLLWIESSN